MMNFFAIALAAAELVYGIFTGPGQDASTQMGISWAADTTAGSTFVKYTVEKDASWKHARTVRPQQEELWTAFDGVFSDDINGKECYEHARFIKCGVMLDGLRPDTEYKYVVVDGNGKEYPEHHFKTAGAREWSCCIISDFHSYPPLPKRLESAMDMIRTVEKSDPSVDWIFSPGDVVAWGGSYSFWRRLFEEEAFHKYFWGRVNGNHDNWTKESQITHNFDIPNDYFLGTSYFPRNSFEGEQGVVYHFRYGNALFLMLNTEDMNKKEVFTATRDWMRKVVTEQRAGSNPPDFVIVCTHYEWFIGTNGRTSEYGRWHELFDELGVDLAVAGNNHVYLRTDPIYQGKVMNPLDKKGTVYLVTSSSDDGRGRSFHESRFDNMDLIQCRWTEGPHTVSAVNAVFSPNDIKLKLLDRKGNVIDQAVVYKK